MDKVILTCIFVTLALVHGRAQSAPSPAEAPAPTTDCSSLIYDMMDCMAFLTSGGNETKPDESCCLGVKTVVDANPECVCYALSVGVSLGLNLNMTKASILSSACAISVPPLIDISPVATPELSPEPSPMASPVNPPALSPPSQPNLPPTTEPPTTTPVPGGAPATPPTADAGVTVTPASAQKKNGSSTISATFSVVFALLISFFLKPLA